MKKIQNHCTILSIGVLVGANVALLLLLLSSYWMIVNLLFLLYPLVVGSLIDCLLYLFFSASPSPATCPLAFWKAQLPHWCSYSYPLIEWLLAAIPPLPPCCRFVDWLINFPPSPSPMTCLLGSCANAALLLLLLFSYWMIVNCYSSFTPLLLVCWLIDCCIYFSLPAPLQWPFQCPLAFWKAQLLHWCSYSYPLIEWLLAAIPPLPPCCRFVDWLIYFPPSPSPVTCLLGSCANDALLLLLLFSYWMIVSCYSSFPPLLQVRWLIDYFIYFSLPVPLQRPVHWHSGRRSCRTDAPIWMIVSCYSSFIPLL